LAWLQKLTTKTALVAFTLLSSPHPVYESSHNPANGQHDINVNQYRHERDNRPNTVRYAATSFRCPLTSAIQFCSALFRPLPTAPPADISNLGATNHFENEVKSPIPYTSCQFYFSMHSYIRSEIFEHT